MVVMTGSWSLAVPPSPYWSQSGGLTTCLHLQLVAKHPPITWSLFAQKVSGEDDREDHVTEINVPHPFTLHQPSALMQATYALSLICAASLSILPTLVVPLAHLTAAFLTCNMHKFQSRLLLQGQQGLPVKDNLYLSLAYGLGMKGRFGAVIMFLFSSFEEMKSFLLQLRLWQGCLNQAMIRTVSPFTYEGKRKKRRKRAQDCFFLITNP